jgi:hypothetical protein
LDLRNLIFPGGFRGKVQDSKVDLLIFQILQGVKCKAATLSSSSSGQTDRTGQSKGGGSGGHGRRHSGRLGAWMRCKTERGDREDRDDVLTSGGGRRNRPDFCGQRRRRGWFVSSPARQCGGAACAAAGGGVTRPRAAGRARPAGGGALYRGASPGTPAWKAAAAARPAAWLGPDGPWRAGPQARAGWVGPLARPNPVG